MLRLGASVILGFTLLILQGFIVMKLNGYSSLQFQSAPGVLAVYLLNCALSFSMMSQLKPWMEKRLRTDSE